MVYYVYYGMLDSLLSPWGTVYALRLPQTIVDKRRFFKESDVHRDVSGWWGWQMIQRALIERPIEQRFLHVPRLPAPWTESPLWQNRNIIQQSSYIKWYLVANISKFRINGALYSLIIHWHLSSWNAGSLDKWTRRFWNASPRCGRSPVARGAPDLKVEKTTSTSKIFRISNVVTWRVDMLFDI